MKSIEEIDEALASRYLAEAHLISFRKLTRQALEWARQKIADYGNDAEAQIRERIKMLEALQAVGGVMGAFTKPARANHITALKWILDEADLEALEPLH